MFKVFGLYAEILAQRQALAQKTNSFIYGHEQNGGTNTFYVSPIHFEVLTKI